MITHSEHHEKIVNAQTITHHHPTTMPRRTNRKAAKYEDHEHRVTKSLQELDSHPDAKIKDVAEANGLARKTLYNRSHGKTGPS